MQPADKIPGTYPLIELWDLTIPMPKTSQAEAEGDGRKPAPAPAPPSGIVGEVRAAARSDGARPPRAVSKIEERIPLLTAYRDLYPPELPMHACVHSIVQELDRLRLLRRGAEAESAVLNRAVMVALRDAGDVFASLKEQWQKIREASDKTPEHRKHLSVLRDEESQILDRLAEAARAVDAAWNDSLRLMREGSSA